MAAPRLRACRLVGLAGVVALLAVVTPSCDGFVSLSFRQQQHRFNDARRSVAGETMTTSTRLFSTKAKARTTSSAPPSASSTARTMASLNTTETSSPSAPSLYSSPTGLDIPVSIPVLEQGAAAKQTSSSPFQGILDTYLGPRAILLVLAAVYATNFPLGALMNDNLPASAATCSRMVLAALALSPFVGQIKPSLRLPAVMCGFFTATGYITQSLALVDIDPAKVSFLGSATVLWCPLLEAFIDKKPMGLKQAPQTWLAAVLCLLGVGMLELPDASGLALSSSSSLVGDGLALLQAVGFGTGVWWTSKMVNQEPDQALPVTATLISTTAFLSMLWCLADGWMTQPGWQHLALPGMFLDPSLQQVAMAVAWTGIISTSLNFFIELTALGRVPPSEASVLLATEPLWAALFAAVMFGETMGTNDYLGGALVVAACLVNAVLKPTDFFKQQED